MAKEVIIIGSGGHAKVIADIVLKSGDILVGFLDDDESKQGKTIYLNYKVIGKISDCVNYTEKLFIVAIGNNDSRARIVEENDLRWYTAIHPQAIVADTVTIGEGTVVMAGVVINPDTNIGRHCIINTSCSIDHDNNIGDFVHISPGAHLAGTVSVGNKTWICAGVTVINNINIVSNVIVGAGATVIDDIKIAGVYVGTPVKCIKRK